MGNESGEWIMHGVSPDDPRRIHDPAQLLQVIDEVGFLPLFECGIPGASVEERTVPDFWWSGDEKNDPWEWRRIIAGSGKAAYGKFFDKKAGFVSLAWFPYLINARRDGYDFEGWWEDGKATKRAQSIMELFDTRDELFSFDIKKLAGFGKDGEKNFEGTITELMMKTFLTVKDFRMRLNRQGQPYGWHIAVYAPPEHIWGEDHVNSADREKPDDSRTRIREHLRLLYPDAPEKQLTKVFGI
ncbi:MAG: hypothetical protein Q4G19_00910 [Clostridia bacterium]|nr:hypothetical protein [Clostridia bacterium]